MNEAVAESVPVESDEHFQLDNAPIIEAVVDIDCDMPPEFNAAAVETEARNRFSDHYPNLKKSFALQHRMIARPNEAPQVSSTQAVHALQFFSQDSLQLVQVRSNGYSFNRLRPYSTLDDYLPEIERTWNVFVELVQPVRVRRIALRYINRILLPCVKPGRIPLDQYLRLGPLLPHDDELTYMGFFNQYAAIETATQNTITITLTAQPAEEGNLPVIFDIEARREFGAQPDDWNRLREVILSLRRLKNRVFKRTLSDQCLNLFRN
jgi:uncharacterized protein (TIGR04255 family)